LNFPLFLAAAITFSARSHKHKTNNKKAQKNVIFLKWVYVKKRPRFKFDQIIKERSNFCFWVVEKSLKSESNKKQNQIIKRLNLKQPISEKCLYEMKRRKSKGRERAEQESNGFSMLFFDDA
jgi:hypothetical protein